MNIKCAMCEPKFSLNLNGSVWPLSPDFHQEITHTHSFGLNAGMRRLSGQRHAELPLLHTSVKREINICSCKPLKCFGIFSYHCKC